MPIYRDFRSFRQRHTDRGGASRHGYNGRNLVRFASIRRAFFWTTALLFSAGNALANGRFPATNAVVVQPGNPKTMALRATYGLLISKDEGNNWDWICERAIGFSGNEDPSLVLTDSGAIVVGTFSGMSVSTDGGCHWSHDASWPTNVIDLTIRPTASNRIYAVTNAYSKMTDAGSNLYASQLFISEDAGAHWTIHSSFDPTLLIDSIEVAPNDPKRAYVSAVRDSRGVLLVSDDDGAHWKEHEIKLISPERGVYIAAVDPKNASRIYVRTASTETGRVLVSDDAGVSFRQIASGGLFQGFALADEGATIFAGDQFGLLRGAAGDDRFHRMSGSPVQCLTQIGATLWECLPTRIGYVLGASNDRGATFSSKLAFDGMRGELQCAAPNSLAVCAEDWSALQALVHPTPIVDASVAPVASSVPQTKHSIFSCSSSSRNSENMRQIEAFFAIIGALAMARRSRNRN